MLCVILNITTAILMHAMGSADCLPFRLIANCLTLQCDDPIQCQPACPDAVNASIRAAFKRIAHALCNC